jgi:hypothetical protein
MNNIKLRITINNGFEVKTYNTYGRIVNDAVVTDINVEYSSVNNCTINNLTNVNINNINNCTIVNIEESEIDNINNCEIKTLNKLKERTYKEITNIDLNNSVSIKHLIEKFDCIDYKIKRKSPSYYYKLVDLPFNEKKEYNAVCQRLDYILLNSTSEFMLVIDDIFYRYHLKFIRLLDKNTFDYLINMISDIQVKKYLKEVYEGDHYLIVNS